MIEITIFYSEKLNKWIADPVNQPDNPEVGIGNTPHESLGSLICANFKQFSISKLTKVPIRRSDISGDTPQEGL